MVGFSAGAVHGRQVHEVPSFQRRLDRQAERTRALPLYERAGLHVATRVLDVGAGSGGVTADLIAGTPGSVVAVDIDRAMATRAATTLQGPRRTLQADGRSLPFPDASFDLVVCNLVLLWTPDPGALVKEMARVVRPGGTVLASMEPDYGGKVHHPENPLIDLVFQGEGVRLRGGDPHAGRRLREHFVKAGLRTDVGLAQTEVFTPEEDLDQFRRNRGYYQRLLRESGRSDEAIRAWEAEYEDALAAGTQLSFLPVFYAIGRKPVPDDVDRA